MDLLLRLLHLIREPGEIIVWGGYPGLGLVIFLETGAMVFFLPGDSLLVTAGLYAAKGDLSIWYLNLLLIPLAILGDATSYYLGARSGPHLFNRPQSRFFKPEHLKRAQAFYEKHGGKAIIIARFMPLVRTFVPVVAGVAKMPYRRFALFNVVGAAGWVSSMTVGGYLLGSVIPGIDKHIEKVIVLVVFASILPGIISYFRAKASTPPSAPAT
jgi:membrane-associated protein